MEPRNAHDELRDAPTLRAMPKVDPFVVPEGFFDRFPHQVQARIATPEGSFARLWRTLTEASMALQLAGITAVVAIVAGVVLINLPNTPDPITDMTQLTVDPTEISVDDLDDADVYAMLDDAPDLMADVGPDLTTEEMAAYLENENLPLDLLIEEL